jgi:hypothetical protein
MFQKMMSIICSPCGRAKNTKGPRLEEFLVLQEFEDVFQEIPWLPPKREIDLSIYLVPGVAPVSKTPYIMSTPKLKELQI